MNKNQIIQKLTQNGLVAGCITTTIFNKYNFNMDDKIIIENETITIECEDDVIIMFYEDILDITVICRGGKRAEIMQRLRNLDEEYNKVEEILIHNHSITEEAEERLLNMLNTINNSIARLSAKLKLI